MERNLGAVIIESISAVRFRVNGIIQYLLCDLIINIDNKFVIARVVQILAVERSVFKGCDVYYRSVQ